MRSGGLVDLQVNGFAGVDFNTGPGLDGAAIDRACEAMLATGVTCCLPTIITGAADLMAARIRALDAAISASQLGPILCPGYHIEGPFLRAEEGYAGCHPADAMTDPDWRLIERLEHGLARPALLITVAPERAGAVPFIREARAAGKLVAVGHSAAGPEALADAIAAGLTLSTHLGNGLPPVLPKLDNTVFAQLAADDLVASVIADGIHLPPHALKVLLRAKGAGRVALVTDATAAAGTKPGRYSFAGMTIEHGQDGSVRVPGGRSLAGSSLCLDQAVRNLVRWGIASVPEALAMASDVPRALLAPALLAHGLKVAAGEVTWFEDGRPDRVRHG